MVLREERASLIEEGHRALGVVQAIGVDLGCFEKEASLGFGARRVRGHRHQLFRDRAVVFGGQQDAPNLCGRKRILGIDPKCVAVGDQRIIAPAQALLEQNRDVDGDGERGRPFAGVLQK